MGEDIPSVVDEEYNYQVIQFYDFKLEDIKKATFVANIYQEIIKSPCVIRLYDNSNEVYSFSLKRLNQNDKTQIIVTDKLFTIEYPVVIPSFDKITFQNEIEFNNIKNKNNKVVFYLELYVRAYIKINDKLYANIKNFLSKPIWYNENKIKEVYKLLCYLAKNKEKVQKSISNSEKMKLNQEIRKLISELDNLIIERV